MCKNSCRRTANFKKGFETCCKICVGLNGPHTKDCDDRSNPKSKKFLLTLNGFEGINKSAGLSEGTQLFTLLSDIRKVIELTFGNEVSPVRIAMNSAFHVELVDSPNDVGYKKKNYDAINGLSIDLSKSSQWYSEGKGAFCLRIGKFAGHKTDLHITISYFQNGIDDNKLANLKTIVEGVLRVDLR